MLRCHYVVLGVELTATDDQLKQAYRKQALLWHPDRNLDNREEAEARFKELQGAHTVLADPHERSWYDQHRDAILRGGSGVAGEATTDGSDGSSDPANGLWFYFTGSAYSGYEDGPRSFYTVFAQLFAALDAEECGASPGRVAAPVFGSSAEPWVEVREFYARWEAFATGRSCAQYDRHDLRRAPDRKVRRAMEKENERARSEARRALSDTVCTLVRFVKRRDWRVKDHVALAEAEVHACA